MLKALMLFVMCVLPAVGSRACSIPVFRYALERWTPSQYELVVFSRGPLEDADQRWLDQCESGLVNLAARQVDVAARMSPEDEALWKEEKEARLPHAVVRYPDSDADAPIVWRGRFDRTEIARQIDSPLRRRIAQSLISGHAAVWVMVESGKKAADDKLAGEVEAALRSLELKIELPEIDPTGPQLLSPLPLKVSFSLLRLSRSDLAESALLKQLLQVDPRFSQSDEAMIIPVIGRGRAVAVLPQSRFSPAVLENFAGFVCGECSCEIKEQNPGLDLLMTADWESIFGAHARPQVEQMSSGIVGGANVPIPSGIIDPVPNSDASVKRPARRWMLVGVVVAFLAALLSAVAGMRTRRNQA